MSKIPWFDQLAVGCGVNCDTLQTYRTGIDFLKEEPAFESQGQSSVLTMKVIKTTSDLAEHLEVSASAALAMRGGQGSVEAKFFSDNKLNSYYTYSLVTVYVENPPKLIKNQTLKPDAKKMLKDYGWDKFSQFYGLDYVQGYVSGGIYYALIEVQTTNAEEKREISGKLSGSYKGFGVKASVTADAENDLQKVTQNESIKVYVAQSGGSGSLIQTTMEDMIQRAKEFPEIVLRNPVPIRALINSYKASVDEVPADVPDTSLALLEQKRCLERLGKLYMELQDYETRIEFVSDNFNLFDEYKDLSQDKKREEKKKLEAYHQKIKHQSDLVIAAAEDCTRDYKNCKGVELPVDFFDSIALPEGDLMITQQILSGSSLFEFPPTHEFRNMDTGDRVDTKHISFPKGKFKTPPNVVVSLKEIDVDKNRGIRVNVFPINITTDGFDLAYKTWADSVVYAIDATWFAHGS